MNIFVITVLCVVIVSTFDIQRSNSLNRFSNDARTAMARFSRDNRPNAQLPSESESDYQHHKRISNTVTNVEHNIRKRPHSRKQRNRRNKKKSLLLPYVSEMDRKSEILGEIFRKYMTRGAVEIKKSELGTTQMSLLQASKTAKTASNTADLFLQMASLWQNNIENGHTLNEYKASFKEFMDTVKTSCNSMLEEFKGNSRGNSILIHNLDNNINRLWFSDKYSPSFTFEHVFFGGMSRVNDKRVYSVGHNWLRLAELYRPGDPTYEYCNTHPDMIKAQKSQGSTETSTMFVGTAPEFEILIYTLCFWAFEGQKCKIRMGDYNLYIIFGVGENGQITTVYPSC